MPGLYVSSPMNATDGNEAESRVDTIFSTAWSASVTISTAVEGRNDGLLARTLARWFRFAFLLLAHTHVRLLGGWQRRTVELGTRVKVCRVRGENHPAGLVSHSHHFIAHGFEIEVRHLVDLERRQ